MTDSSKLTDNAIIRALSKWRIKSSFIWAAVIAIGISAWILSGQLGDRAQSEDLALNSQMETLVTVRARRVVSEPHTTYTTIRGRTQAKRSVVVRAETVGTVVAVPAEEGSVVEKGDVLCELSLNARLARKREAEATIRQRKLEYDAARTLIKSGHKSETQLAAAEAAYDAAKAALERIEVEIGQTKIRAPFRGILDDRAVEVGDYMRAGDACATVVDMASMLVVGQVSESEVGKLHTGDQGTVQLIDGSTAQGRITFISERADPATRTFRIEMEIPNPNHAIRDGITSKIRIPHATVRAYHLSPSTLVLNDRGQIGVRTVDEDSIVRFVPVSLVSDTAQGVWITGPTGPLRVITVGQEYVAAGEKVRVVMENDEVQS